MSFFHQSDGELQLYFKEQDNAYDELVSKFIFTPAF